MSAKPPEEERPGGEEELSRQAGGAGHLRQRRQRAEGPRGLRMGKQSRGDVGAQGSRGRWVLRHEAREEGRDLILQGGLEPASRNVPDKPMTVLQNLAGDSLPPRVSRSPHEMSPAPPTICQRTGKEASPTGRTSVAKAALVPGQGAGLQPPSDDLQEWWPLSQCGVGLW